MRGLGGIGERIHHAGIESFNHGPWGSTPPPGAKSTALREPSKVLRPDIERNNRLYIIIGEGRDEHPVPNRLVQSIIKLRELSKVRGSGDYRYKFAEEMIVIDLSKNGRGDNIFRQLSTMENHRTAIIRPIFEGELGRYDSSYLQFRPKTFRLRDDHPEIGYKMKYFKTIIDDSFLAKNPIPPEPPPVRRSQPPPLLDVRSGELLPPLSPSRLRSLPSPPLPPNLSLIHI